MYMREIIVAIKDVSKRQRKQVYFLKYVLPTVAKTHEECRNNLPEVSLPTLLLMQNWVKYMQCDSWNIFRGSYTR